MNVGQALVIMTILIYACSRGGLWPEESGVTYVVHSGLLQSGVKGTAALGNLFYFHLDSAVEHVIEELSLSSSQYKSLHVNQCRPPAQRIYI